MSTEANESVETNESNEAAVEEAPPQYGLDAVRAIIEGKTKEPEKPAAQEPPKPTGGEKKHTVGSKIKALRQERRKLQERLAALEGGKTEPAPAAAAPSGITLDPEAVKRDPIAALVKAGVPRDQLLDLVQKHALTHGALPPAVASVVDELKEATAAALKRAEAAERRLEEMEARHQEREDQAANEAGVRLLQAEAQNKEAYPELEGYDWADLEEPIFGAIDYLIQQQGAKGVKNPQATPAEVMGLVNAAFKAHHDKVAKRGGRPAAEPPPPPQKKKPTLAPVVPARSGGKVRLPTTDVIEQRVARASAGR